MLRHRVPLFVLVFSAGAAVLLPQPARCLPSPDAATGPWELVRNENGISIHRRTVAGSKLHEFRGAGLIEAPIATVLAVLNDSAHRLEWMKEAAANTRIEQPDPYTEIFYSRTKAPWPVAHRDVVLRAHTTFDTAAHQVRIEIVSNDHPSWPPQKGVVRMPFLRGHWYLWPENGGTFTRAEYQVHANPGGMLPDWIINLVSKKIPYETLSGMQQQVKRRRYSDFEKQVVGLSEYQQVINIAAPKPAPPALPGSGSTPATASGSPHSDATPAPTSATTAAAPPPAAAGSPAPAGPDGNPPEGTATGRGEHD